VFVYLAGEPTTLTARIGNRVHEYMPSTLLQSQLATLEAPEEDEAFVMVDINDEPEAIVDRIVAQLMSRQLPR
jgi:gluconokinase